MILPADEAAVLHWFWQRYFFVVEPFIPGWTGRSSVTLNCHIGCSQISLALQLDYAMHRHTFSQASFLYSCTSCFYCGAVQRCCTVHVTKLFIVLSGPLKSHPLCRFETATWLQNSMWDRVPVSTSRSSLHNVQRELYPQININMFLLWLAPVKPLGLGVELWRFLSCGNSSHKKFIFSYIFLIPASFTVSSCFPLCLFLRTFGILFFIVHQWCWLRFILMHSLC